MCDEVPCHENKENKITKKKRGVYFQMEAAPVPNISTIWVPVEKGIYNYHFTRSRRQIHIIVCNMIVSNP
ncbi:hypothetical protein DFO70_1445 [Cytobacillus firmus]|uniref:Uncharacterized protein n=2 Tax=Cytobacillus TaxID=2675230 RepID=A0A366JHU4_CYTFI|nr:hypothetical protein DFO70_1445 [Cytobacillus firmus]TDX35481.1 hypothetical protein DFO72_12715 [Cytobacillus oceanisediminis]